MEEVPQGAVRLEISRMGPTLGHGLFLTERPMNEIERAKLAPLVSTKPPGYELHPYILTDLMRVPVTILWGRRLPFSQPAYTLYLDVTVTEPLRSLSLSR